MAVIKSTSINLLTLTINLLKNQIITLNKIRYIYSYQSYPLQPKFNIYLNENKMPMPKHLLETGYYLPYNPELKQVARELRKNQTPAENKLWRYYLKTFRYTVLRQRPIDNFIVDFYCAALKLVIEVDGDSHFTDNGIAYDLERTQILEGYGLKVIRFTNDEVMKTFEGVCARIEELVNNI